MSNRPKKHLRPTVLLLLGFFIGFTGLAIDTRVAQAASAPRPSGCYWREGQGDFEDDNCTSSYQTAVDSRDACFLTRNSNGTVFFEVACNNFAYINNSPNTSRARTVCEATDNAYWNPDRLDCHYGRAGCREIMVSATVYAPSAECTVTVDRTEDMYSMYVRNELPGLGGPAVGTTTPPPATPNPSPGGFFRDQEQQETQQNPGGGDSPTTEEDIGQQGALTAECKTSEWEPKLNEGNCEIIGYLVTGINVLSGFAGLTMVFSFIFAGYQYITARDNPQFVQSAKNRILWTLIALFTFLFMYAGLNWLVPGGVLP